ncbi:MAG: hypothetical protein IPL79_09105 [Myxococcales bacterium]|nr:hypothetical protein [Myxococcales bacterium]
MKQIFTRLGFGMAMWASMACGGGNDEVVPPPDGTPPACDEIWTVTNGDADATAVIAGGELVLTAPNADAFSAVAVAQTLSGDFDIRFDFDPASLVEGGFAQATIGLDGEALAVAGIGTLLPLGEVDFTGLGVAVGDKQDPVFNATDLQAGSLRLTRTGTTITATATVEGTEATLSGENQSTDPVQVGLQLGRHPTMGAPLIGTSSITAQGFVVISGDAEADPFDCDSLVD